MAAQGDGIAVNLGEEESYLDGGEQGGGQSVGVSGSSEVTALVGASYTIADRGFLLVEALGEVGVGVVLSELSGACGTGQPPGIRLDVGTRRGARTRSRMASRLGFGIARGAADCGR